MSLITKLDVILNTLLLPKSFPIERYDIVGIDVRPNKGDNRDLYEEMAVIKLKEKNIAPDGYASEELESLGFAEPKYVRDLPVRDRYYSLEIQKRRRRIKETGKTVVSDLDIIEEGTRITVDAAAFFKEGTR